MCWYGSCLRDNPSRTVIRMSWFQSTPTLEIRETSHGTGSARYPDMTSSYDPETGYDWALADIPESELDEHAAEYDAETARRQDRDVD